MKRYNMILIVGLLLNTANFGCWSRMIREGAGAATGASGKVFELRPPGSLTQYKGMKIESTEVTQGLEVDDGLASLVDQLYSDYAQKAGLTTDGTPCLAIKGEIIHYESGGAVNKAIGPFSEIIVRTKMSDAGSGDLLGEANLIGRSKAITSSGKDNLSEGAGKALKKWLKECGLEMEEEEKEGEEKEGEEKE